MAENVGIAPTALRTVRRQIGANAAATGPKEYYLVNVVIPFLDHIISELDDQCSDGLMSRVRKLLGLVPSKSQVTVQQLTDLVFLYKDDLRSPQLFSAEFQRWKIKVQTGIITADSCAASLPESV